MYKNYNFYGSEVMYIDGKKVINKEININNNNDKITGYIIDNNHKQIINNNTSNLLKKLNESNIKYKKNIRKKTKKNIRKKTKKDKRKGKGKN